MSFHLAPLPLTLRDLERPGEVISRLRIFQRVVTWKTQPDRAVFSKFFGCNTTHNCNCLKDVVVQPMFQLQTYLDDPKYSHMNSQ